MASQLGYVYSANRLAERPFQTILHTSFSPASSPRLWEKMLKTKREVWNRCYWTEGGIDRLAQKFGQSSKSTSAPEPAQGPSDDPSLSLPETISPGTHSLVYLSADAEEELETLKENEIYIIGGIVDKNRHKVYSSRSRPALTT
jgi:tRNA (guanine9-N1)-methyltransferase